jgi:hypothetical protein
MPGGNLLIYRVSQLVNGKITRQPPADIRRQDTEPPAYNCRFLESRLAYHIQELAYGGLSRATLERLVNRRQDRVHPHSRCSGIGLEHHHFKQLREYGDVADRIWHDRTWFA